LPADASDPPTRPEVAVGRYVLVLGDPAGTAIVPVASQDEPRPLAQAIAQSRREDEPPPTVAASLESAVEDASQTTSEAEHVVSLFTEIAQGRIDPAAIKDEVDALLGLLRRLDRDDRWGEALRVARSLAMLLALLGRWLDLLQSLQVALSDAEQLGDVGGKAWALHELGTLHLAAETHADADRLLSQAHDLRERIGDRRGLAITDRNLQILCRALRALLHEPPRRGALDQILRRPVPALVLGILLLVAGGAAGAMIRGSGNSAKSTKNQAATVAVSGIRGTTTGGGTRAAVVHPESASRPNPTKPNARFSFKPDSPVVGERVSFDATTSSPDPNASITSYRWKFGDGQTATGSTLTHVYARPGTYRTELTVADTRGAMNDTAHKIAVTNTTTVPPTVELGTPSVEGLKATINGVALPGGDTSVTGLSWNWGDGTQTSGFFPQSRTYASAGTYTVTVTATDSDGLTRQASTKVRIEAFRRPS
jgi:PKD repeat protein